MAGRLPKCDGASESQSEAETPPERLALPDSSQLAYRRLAAAPGAPARPGIVFLGGFASDMGGIKATALAAHCRARGMALLRFDYLGHGASSGRFAEGTIGRWRNDALAALDRLTEGPQILVGSSMGAWIMLLVAAARPQRVAGLVGIAAAPDFTERLIRPALSPAQRAALAEHGALELPSEYGPPLTVTAALLEEGRGHLLLDQPLPFRGPVRLLHGMADKDVPWTLSQEILARLAGEDIVLTLIKDGDHRLSRSQDLARILAAVDELTGATLTLPLTLPP
jgi:pimeloyl-ACP methyl ester carboxylesterase